MALANIPLHTLEKQRQASDPGASVWVSANAGSGKTHVLAQRVVRLLLQGAPPSKILCLTFTKAAAANMATRVFDTLALWTRLDDADLRKSIIATGAPDPGARERVAARKLFARTVETPGGLKIQTIHAFCERLLHLFPFEANAPARFEVADEMGQAELLQRARREVLDHASRDDAALAVMLSRVTEDCSGQGFETLVKEAMRHRAMSRASWPQNHESSLRKALGLAAGRDVAAIRRQMIEDGITPARWREIATFLEAGGATDRKRAALFRQAAAHRADGDAESCLGSYLSIFFKDDDERYVSLLTKALAKQRPDIEAGFYAEQERLEVLRAEQKAAATVERSVALALLVDAIFQRYEAMKAARGILDFDDLVSKTLALLERSEAAWVLYKLDAGIDHILVDEAQDTSAAQWRILERLTGDFAVGAGSATSARTFFAVGDEKQSIFSFQGAAPHMFGEMRQKFERKFTAGAETFAHVRLTQSFRSAPGVLAAVDKVFAPPAHQNGLVADLDVWMPHEALKEKLPGLVEIWPPVGVEARESARDWRLPLDILDEVDPASLIAQRVAQKIAGLIAEGSGECVYDSAGGGARPVRAGDILILVRTRGAFFDAVIRALKQNGVPVAGADRLELAEHIAVLDLVAAGRAALLPEDDLNLAAVLKSPLIGFDDDDLLALAPRRPASLFEALKASRKEKCEAAGQKLDLWRSRAAQNPFAFYSSLLCEDGGRRAMEARLGPEAADAIDEFLRLALAHEAEAAPSLSGFLSDFEAVERSIKRDMESGADVVRVMTVHAAKGLEAKIVFLPDTCGAPSPRHDPNIFVVGAGPSAAIAWSPRKAADCQAVALARENMRGAGQDEYRRLLYVALTRAEERLYIAGFHGSRGRAQGCWGEMIDAALANDPDIESAPAFWNADESILRLVSKGGYPASLVSRAPPAAAASPPDWLWRRVDPVMEPAPPIRPSSALASADRWVDSSLTPARREALRLGSLTHVLLQYLPDLPPESRSRAGLAFLGARAGDLDAPTREDLLKAALAVIGAPELAPLFGPQSRAEVAVSGKIALPREKSIEIIGRIDRLGIAGDDVLVADFKTGAPCATADIPARYLTQMALYRAVLAPLWPAKRLRMLLIWTDGPLVATLDDALLDGALAAVA
ncbi:double-strand break repair helicase AddA [Methylocella tundrae]|uniref:DNA 3'-5' helicase n=1 Tax=Methylocella tundrae TaxID=227605 RepID=A0A4U8Z178_METTU|nr:double-strand break repair helicase AddA [Methylocella tundrae]WPP06346.1 double-strand break repair helicase AddA [Methylocella tundrae]VFU09045.1 Double-strand break repair helicase AddA [Methylocella tundrae]